MAYLDAVALTNIRAALFDRDEAARERAMIAILEAEQSIADPDLIAAAVIEHGHDGLQIDADAGTSDTDEGTWVQAWVFMADESDGCETCAASIETRPIPCDECGHNDQDDSE